MSIHGFLNPEQYAETRTSSPLRELHIALIYGGHYYLIPACQANTEIPTDLETVRGQVAAILNYPSEDAPAELQLLAKVQRSQWPNLLKKLPPKLLEDLGVLRLCPIMLNVDPRRRG